MSGGSHNYICYKVEELEGKMHDKELDVLVKDFSEILHDLEWCDSGDISIEDYEESVKNFKEKWFGHRKERLSDIIVKSCEDLKAELIKMI